MTLLSHTLSHPFLLLSARLFSSPECLLLDLAAKYTPKDENSVFDIMNLLEDRLKHSNSAVVLGTTKVFLNYTLNMPRVNEEVYKRLKAPLLTLMTGGSHELSFSILAHIHILVQKYPLIFADSFKHFFVRFNDPSSVKMQKLNIITQLATQGNMIEILGELSEYVTDIDADISRFAIRAIGRISIRIPAAAEESIEHLLAFLDLHIDHVTSETVIVLKVSRGSSKHRPAEQLEKRMWRVFSRSSHCCLEAAAEARVRVVSVLPFLSPSVCVCAFPGFPS